MTETKRAIRPLNTAGLNPGPVNSEMPTVRYVQPGTLLVDEIYQRGLSENSIALIRRIVEHWDWARFKPPVVAEMPDGLEIIDGQHTAIAAATHPGITEIPVIVVRADGVEDRARAFVGHNRDRLNITPMQMYFASCAAGDEVALTIKQVCERAGVTILKNPPSRGVFAQGDCIAVSTLSGLINRRGARGARMILDVLVAARCAPVASNLIRAVEYIMHEPEYKDSVDPSNLSSTILRLGPDLEREGKIFASAQNLPVWRGVMVVLFKKTPKMRRVS